MFPFCEGIKSYVYMPYLVLYIRCNRVIYMFDTLYR